MKKKGLIIATIVMVLVLAVSLTTATYAWFTASSNTSIDTIELSVKAANSVSIDAKVGNGNTQDDYMYETVTLGRGTAGTSAANTPSYTGSTTGLGSTLGFAGEGTTTLNLSTAVATANTITVAQAPASIDEGFNPSHIIFKANAGTSDTTVKADSVNYADANLDYVVLKMGAQAAKAGVKGIYAEIKITTSDTATTLKMMAAMHFYISVNGVAFNEIDLFGSNRYSTSKSNLTASSVPGITYSTVDNQAVATIRFEIAGNVTATEGSGENATVTGADLASNGSAIVPFDIYAYVYGPDNDCISTQTGCSAKFDIEFFGVSEVADVVAANTLLGYPA